MAHHLTIMVAMSDGAIAASARSPDRGAEATRAVSATSRFDLHEYVFAGLRAGASGVLLEDAPTSDLRAAIRTIAEGADVIAAGATWRLIDRFADRLPDPPLACESGAITPGG